MANLFIRQPTYSKLNNNEIIYHIWFTSRKNRQEVYHEDSHVKMKLTMEEGNIQCIMKFTSKQVPMSNPCNWEPKFVIEPS